MRAGDEGESAQRCINKMLEKEQAKGFLQRGDAGLFGLIADGEVGAAERLVKRSLSR
jgi:hypothetical protein